MLFATADSAQWNLTVVVGFQGEGKVTGNWPSSSQRQGYSRDGLLRCRTNVVSLPCRSEVESSDHPHRLAPRAPLAAPFGRSTPKRRGYVQGQGFIRGMLGQYAARRHDHDY